jgi:hypothetical protein
MQKRTISWKQLQNLHKQEFLIWLDENGRLLNLFKKLAEDLERYIMMSLTPTSVERELGLTTDDKCRKFIERIPGVFSNCDDLQMYDKDLAALAYAHVHLLERYRRFWDVLICLLNASVLPLSDKGIEVLDVGTGPAPALYVVADLYQALQDFASEKGYDLLLTPPPKLDGVEFSSNMRNFIHYFSEESGRSKGPYFVSFSGFEGLDFAKLRANKRCELSQVEEYYDHETETWETVYVEVGNLGWTEGLYRYNLVVFSNFLTEEERTGEWRKELLSTFLSARHGGIVVVVGGVGESYPPIYDIVREVAKEAALSRLPFVDERIPCQYSDAYAQRIKEHYNTIWKWIKLNSSIDDDFLRSYTVKVGERDQKIAKKLWNPSTKLKGPNSPDEFTLLAFRRNGQPWKKIKKGDRN